VALVGDGELAVAERVPQLDGPVARAGDDLAVIGGEGDGEHVVGVADEAAGGGTGGELPEAQRLIPGRGEGVGTVRGDDLSCNCQLRLCDLLASQLLRRVGRTYAIGDDVRVAVQTALRVAVRRLVAGEVPDDERLVPGCGQEHVRAGRKSACAQFSMLQLQGAARAISQTYFSREVAREVTQPLWPSRVPRRTNCSAMVDVEWLKLRVGLKAHSWGVVSQKTILAETTRSLRVRL
jgi:hypothetical protein